MSDHIAAVRAQAEREAERLWPSYQTVGFSGAADRQAAYVEGQVAIASRLTREKIADAITNRPTGQSAADAILALLVDDTQR